MSKQGKGSKSSKQSATTLPSVITTDGIVRITGLPTDGPRRDLVAAQEQVITTLCEIITGQHTEIEQLKAALGTEQQNSESRRRQNVQYLNENAAMQTRAMFLGKALDITLALTGYFGTVEMTHFVDERDKQEVQWVIGGVLRLTFDKRFQNDQLVATSAKDAEEQILPQRIPFGFVNDLEIAGLGTIALLREAVTHAGRQQLKGQKIFAKLYPQDNVPPPWSMPINAVTKKRGRYDLKSNLSGLRIVSGSPDTGQYAGPNSRLTAERTGALLGQERLSSRATDTLIPARANGDAESMPPEVAIGVINAVATTLESLLAPASENPGREPQLIGVILVPSAAPTGTDACVDGRSTT